jgi:hypothetical protein
LADVALSKQLITSLPWTLVSVTVVVPYPGSPLYTTMQEKKLLYVEDWEDFVMFGKSPKWRTEKFSSEDLVALQKELIKAFYLRPKYIIQQILGVRSLVDIYYWIVAGKAYLKWYLTGKV